MSCISLAKSSVYESIRFSFNRIYECILRLTSLNLIRKVWLCGVIFPRKIKSNSSWHRFSFTNLLLFTIFLLKNKSIWIVIGLFNKNVLMQTIRVFVNSWNDVVNNSYYYLSICLKRRLNFGANISVSRRAAAATADQSKRNDTTFFQRSKQKVVKNLHHTKCWILLNLKRHLTLYFVFQILWPNKKRRILCTTFTKRQNPNGQIYSTEDSKIGVDCQNQRYLATYLHGTYNTLVKV